LFGGRINVSVPYRHLMLDIKIRETQLKTLSQTAIAMAVEQLALSSGDTHAFTAFYFKTNENVVIAVSF
jgi:hypothetical protein